MIVAIRWQVAATIAGLAVALLGGIPDRADAAVGVLARSSGPGATLQSALPAAPVAARHVAPVLQRALDLFYARAALQRELQQLRADQDSVKTKLTTVDGDLGLLHTQQAHLEQELRLIDQQQEQRLESLRTGLEERVNTELLQTEDYITKELAQDLTRQLEAFEARQRDMIGQTLEQELGLQERELRQLSQEIDVQTQELVDRLARLEANASLADSVKSSMSQALAKRGAELQTRRKQLEATRDQLLAQRRAEFVARVKQQHQAEYRRRMTIKEASLRQAMADELLQRTRVHTVGQRTRVQQAMEEVQQQITQQTEQHDALTARLHALDKDQAAKTQRLQTMDAEQHEAAARVELVLQQSPSPEAFGWVNEVIRYLPPELASHVGQVQQRLFATVEQERQLQEKARVLRERQLALQLAHVMEQRLSQDRVNQQREQEARGRQAEEFLKKADQLAARGAYDQALQFIAQVQGLNPPQMSRVESLRQQILTERNRTLQQRQAAALEQSFSQAMQAFEQGRYEQAIALFEQVIDEEAQRDEPVAAGAAVR